MMDELIAFMAELKRSREEYYDQLLDRGCNPVGALLIIKRLAGYL